MHQERKTRRSCVADMPLRGEGDQLAADGYARALAAFIHTADTPLTIGIQGGWGSGKTSLFSLIRGCLEGRTKQAGAGRGEKTRPVVCVGVNAWEQSLFQGDASASHVAMNLLSDIIHALSALCDDPDSVLTEKEKTTLAGKVRNTRDALGTLKRSLLRGAEIGLSILAKKDMRGVLRNEGTEESALPESPAAPLRKLRETLDELVGCLPAAAGSPRLVIFIDDLDRVSPAAAVEILDVIKNIFDVPGCVFVLAIDYDVVVKGLEGKLGPRTGKNTHEFRQYLDKIIQVPFTMPVGTISQSNTILLKHLLNSVEMPETSGDTLADDTLKSLGKYARLATEGNPRSIKRIINTLSLLEHIEREKMRLEDEETEKMHQLLGVEDSPAYPDPDEPRSLSLEERFLIVALHINFPEICARLVENPLFPQWSRELDAPWGLDFENEEKKLAALAQNPELSMYFVEEWKKVVYCLCDKTDWLRSHVINIIKLLDHLKESLDLHAGEDNTTILNFYSPSLYPLFSFIDNLCTISGDYDFPRVYTMDSVTYMMRKMHEGLMKEFPDLKFCAPPTNIVAEAVEETTPYIINGKEVFYSGRTYRVKMKGAFDEFTISTDHNLLDMIYRFKFTISGIPETTLREILKNTLPPCDLKNAEQWSFDVIGTDI
ncbi:MAG: hypothetical protein HDQ94_02230, partial [Desulfovibrio sp.]|nr:hypothetical protein [Desulfovibrio sp.]